MSWRSAPAPGWARRYPVLAIRDFRLLLVDRLLAPFSVGFSLVGVSFAVLKVTGSTADLSYVIAAQTAPMLVFSLVSGVFADRFRPQRVIIAGNLAVVVGEGVFGLLMLVTGHPPLWAMISLEAVNGIGGAMFYPASQALLPQLVPGTLLQFRKHTWLWATVIQYCLVMMAWNGGFMVLGPVVARAHLGGAAAWGAISAADALGLILGGLISLRYTPRKPMLFVVCTGGAFAISPLLLGLVAPLLVICLVAFVLGALAEVMMVQWTVAMATRVPSDKLARVSSYDAFGSLAAMPLGALIAGPLAARAGVPVTQFAAAAVIFLASAFTLIPREIWTIRSDDALGGDPGTPGLGAEPPGAPDDLPGAIASAPVGADLG